MDLTLLPHLSERALREEAARRGIPTEGLDRAALVDAIRAHEARAATEPPPAPAPAGRTERGPLGAARAILGRVMDLARSALERRSEPPPPPPSAPDEPIKTRSMARVLEEQGHLARALAIVRELAQRDADPELAEWRARLERKLALEELRERAHALLERRGAFVEVLAAEGARAVVWCVDDAGLARARALLGEDGALTLRIICVVAHPDYSVETRQEDRRPLEPTGYAILDAEPGAKVVASVGLAAGERFVSAAHGAG